MYCVFSQKIELKNEIAWILLKFSDVCIRAEECRLDGTFRNRLLLLPCLLQAEAGQGHIHHPSRGWTSLLVVISNEGTSGSSLEWFSAGSSIPVMGSFTICYLFFILLVASEPGFLGPTWRWRAVTLCNSSTRCQRLLPSQPDGVFPKLTNPNYRSK